MGHIQLLYNKIYNFISQVAKRKINFEILMPIKITKILFCYSYCNVLIFQSIAIENRIIGIIVNGSV